MVTIKIRSFAILLLAMFTSLTYTQCETVMTAGIPEIESTLSQAEAQSLVKLREEELLAHDVYLAFSKLYSIPVFRNISKSEAAHTGAVKTLLDRYGVEDPALGHVTGEFSNPHFQELYNKLVERGSRSIGEALIVGLVIEDMDIADLEEALETEIEKEDIRLVYQNLLRGSTFHMKAFYAHVKGRGLAYTPSYISRERYQEITGAEIP